MSDLERDLDTSRAMASELGRIRDDANWLDRRPDTATMIRQRLKRMLPPAGALTQRLAQLRRRAELARRGEAHRIAQLEKQLKQLPESQRRRAGLELRARCKALELDRRIERLDRGVAEAEQHLRALIAAVDDSLGAYQYRRATRLIDDAARLQRQISKLLQLIERAEQRLLTAGRRAAEAAAEVTA